MESMYHPDSPSFEDRIFALRGLLSAKGSVLSSKIYAHDSWWSKVLGEQSEIDKAEQVIESSLAIASTDFEKEEYERALKEGLITEGEIRDLFAAAHRLEINDRHADESLDQNNQSDSQS